jgi:hypothetical protein
LCDPLDDREELAHARSRPYEDGSALPVLGTLHRFSQVESRAVPLRTRTISRHNEANAHAGSDPII